MSDNKAINKVIKAHLAPYQQVLVAISGGIDSMVLLHALVQLKQQRSHLALRAIYIHHGLSDYADAWAEHCRQVCQRWQIPFSTKKVTINKQQAGLEAGAREARYQALLQHLQPSEVLLTAQHLDDQCETFLLALKRGSGPLGLSAMAVDHVFAHTRLIRPLLTISRQTIEHYAAQHQLSWIEDESNQNEQFDRNFLRLTVLPLLKNRWPHFNEAVARSAELCSEQEQLLDELLIIELMQAMTADGALQIDALKTMSEIKRHALIRRWLAYHQMTMPSRRQLNLIWQEVALAGVDKQPQLWIANTSIRRYQGALYLVPSFVDITAINLSWDGKDPIILPDQLGYLWLNKGKQLKQNSTLLRAPTADEKVSIKFQAKGEVNIVGRQHRRSLKKLWQEFSVPPWQRQRIPLIYFNQQLVAAVGWFVCQGAEAQPQQKCWQIVWQKTCV